MVDIRGCGEGTRGSFWASSEDWSHNNLIPFTLLRASLVAQPVKNLPAMQETLVWFLGSGRSPGEGIGYPLQYSRASLVAQLVKNLPTMWETWVRFLAWEDPLEKGKATHSSILAWRIPWAVQSTGSQRVGYDWATFTHSLEFNASSRDKGIT